MKKQDTIFDKIVSGEIPSWKVWEDSKFLAFLTPFPNTKGQTIVVPKKNVEKLAEAIFAMVNNYENYSKTFSNNISEYEKGHSWEKLARQMLEIAKKT